MANPRSRVQMMALSSFMGEEGLIRRGQDFTAVNQRRADELERRKLAEPKRTKSKATHENKAVQPTGDKARTARDEQADPTVESAVADTPRKEKIEDERRAEQKPRRGRPPGRPKAGGVRQEGDRGLEERARGGRKPPSGDQLG